jgi:hypothetical protein
VRELQIPQTSAENPLTAHFPENTNKSDETRYVLRSNSTAASLLFSSQNIVKWRYQGKIPMSCTPNILFYRVMRNGKKICK